MRKDRCCCRMTRGVSKKQICTSSVQPRGSSSSIWVGLGTHNTYNVYNFGEHSNTNRLIWVVMFHCTHKKTRSVDATRSLPLPFIQSNGKRTHPSISYLNNEYKTVPFHNKHTHTHIVHFFSFLSKAQLQQQERKKIVFGTLASSPSLFWMKWLVDLWLIKKKTDRRKKNEQIGIWPIIHGTPHRHAHCTRQQT